MNRTRSTFILLTVLILWISLVAFYYAGLFSFSPQQATIDNDKKLFVTILWLLLSALNVFITIKPRRKIISSPINVYLAYVCLCLIPAIAASIWLFSGPYIQKGSVLLFVSSCLITLCLLLLTNILMLNFPLSFRWPEFIICFGSILLSLASIVIITNNIRYENKRFFGDDLARVNEDRSYWYYEKKISKDGYNLANSFGFIGSEPDLNYKGYRVLLIGDSIPAASFKNPFSLVAERILQNDGENIEIVNASIPSFSLEQIRKYYLEKLEKIPHDLLLVCFYLDDINRELRFRKNNFLYTPSWPEWMQDFYYQNFFGRKILNIVGVTEKTFLQYRRNTYENSFNSALKTLNRIKETAQQRNARFAILNVPIFSWSGKLKEAKDYKYMLYNFQLEKWCQDSGTPWYDLLPKLASVNIDEYRFSPTNIHFNEKGHQLVGKELKKYILQLMSQDKALR